MAEIVQLDVKAGASLERIATLTDAARQHPINISNYTFWGTIRENYTTNVVAGRFTIEKIAPYELGTVVIRLSPETTAELTQRKYVFDIMFDRNETPESVDVLLEGYLSVRQTTRI